MSIQPENLFGPIPQEVLNELSSEEHMQHAIEAGAEEAKSLLSVTVYNGKYTVIQEANGAVRALRYNEEWRDCCGDGLILALAQEVDTLRQMPEEATSTIAKELRNALDRAAYALFQVKRMSGATDDIISHVSAAHEKACNTLNKIDEESH